MQFENQPDQIQPQSAPAGLTAAGLLHAVKRREELGQSFFRDGNTRVFNRHRMRIQQNADARALRGIEDGVHQNIVQRVGQEILVSPDCHIRSHVLFNVQPLLRKQLFISLRLTVSVLRTKLPASIRLMIRISLMRLSILPVT